MNVNWCQPASDGTGSSNANYLGSKYMLLNAYLSLFWIYSHASFPLFLDILILPSRTNDASIFLSSSSTSTGTVLVKIFCLLKIFGRRADTVAVEYPCFDQ